MHVSKFFLFIFYLIYLLATNKTNDNCKQLPHSTKNNFSATKKYFNSLINVKLRNKFS